jgi:hypothetical protein
MIDPTIYKALQQWALQVVQLAKANLRGADRFATGTLYDSISYKITPDGDVDFFYEDYGDYVESGRKPGSRMPPVGPIMQWATAKRLPQFRDKKGRFISNESRGWLIARAIGRDGFRPVKFFSDAFDIAIEEYPVTVIEDSIAKEIENAFEDAVK